MMKKAIESEEKKYKEIEENRMWRKSNGERNAINERNNEKYHRKKK
jgi:hypothetical protein